MSKDMNKECDKNEQRMIKDMNKECAKMNKH